MLIMGMPSDMSVTVRKFFTLAAARELHQFADVQGGRPAAWGSSKLMRRMSQAESRKEQALSTKTASRPSQTAASPPSEAPAARQKDQVMEASVLAASTCFLGDDVGDHGTVGGLEEGGADGFEEEQRIDQPDHGGGAHQQHAEDDEEARQVGADHDALAADAVVDHAGGGRGEGAGQHLQDDGEADGLGLAAGEIEQQVVDGQGVEPVAEFADDLGEPEQAVSCDCGGEA